MAFGNPGEFFQDGMKGFANSVVDLLSASFTTSNLSENWWVSVVGGTVRTHAGSAVTVVQHPGMLNQLVLVMAPVLVLLAAVQIGISVFRQSSIGVIRAGVAAVFAVPATYIVAGLMYFVITIFDHISVFILGTGNSGTGDGAIAGVLSLMGISWDGTKDQVVLDENYQQWAMASEGGQVLVPLLLMGVIWLLSLILAAFLIFRLMALMILTSATPVVVMSQPLSAAKGLLKGFGTIVLALLMAKPAAAVVLKMGMVLSASAEEMWQFLAGIVALLMAAMMPVLTMKLMNFGGGGGGESIMGGGVGMGQTGLRHAKGLGRSAGRSGSRMARGTGRTVSRTARSTVRGRR
ncbi:hypothetical protein [Arthrobacter pigmenti]